MEKVKNSGGLFDCFDTRVLQEIPKTEIQLLGIPLIHTHPANHDLLEFRGHQLEMDYL